MTAPAEHGSTPRRAQTPRAAPAVAAGVLLLVFALSHRLGALPLFEDPNEGQYAEVAREMTETGEWLSPHLDYVLFLNKPPLQYWLIALSYQLFGVNEAAARLPGVLTAMLAIGLVFLLGRRLFGGAAGLFAAACYAGMPGTIIEARFVRPDGVLVTATIAAVLAFVTALQAAPAQRRRAIAALQVALAAGLMAKGALGLVLPAIPIAALLALWRESDAERQARRTGEASPLGSCLRELARPRSWLLFAALVAPWHIVMALRHEGFAWDYIVNQHFLFFFDEKLPRDSVPISLGEFWGITLARTFPWVLVLPAALAHACSGWRRLDVEQRRARQLVLAWAGGILVFFSLAVSRLEHYALPALPAVALLLGAFFAAAAAQSNVWRQLARAGFALGAVAALAAVFLTPAALHSVDWLRALPELRDVARLYFAGLAATFAGALAIAARRPACLAPGAAVGMLLLMPLAYRGLAAVARFNSSAPVAQVLHAQPDLSAARVVFAAPTEYQNVAGLCFYLRRKIDLLAPPGFLAPDYLAPHLAELFIDRGELARLWAGGPAFLVTDPLAAPPTPVDTLVPEPRHRLADVALRTIISNRPPPPGGPR